MVSNAAGLAEASNLPKGQGDRRSAPRERLGRAGTLRIGHAPPIGVMICDLTREGCRIDTATELEPRALVQIGIANVGITPARVVWRGHDGYGCIFDRPLPPGAVTASFKSTNVVEFPGAGAGTGTAAAQFATKFSRRTQFAVVCGAILCSWAAVAALVLVLV
ncbi:MAG TPA: hypothetical protein VFQ57_05435 [Sphingomonas sp.]|jgi:hypothetical protein|nr:hypothetical protein [Sphingomonas sp.]